jgi:hypothetical protein
MASVSAFNNVLHSFISELAELYAAAEPKIATYAQTFPLLADASPGMPLDMFMNSYGKHTEKISNKDETLFVDVPMLFNEVNVGALWGTTAEENKEAIWKYLQTLVLLGTTIRMIPSSMLSTIESVAMDCAKSMESGQMDPAMLMAALPKMLGSLKF